MIKKISFKKIIVIKLFKKINVRNKNNLKLKIFFKTKLYQILLINNVNNRILVSRINLTIKSKILKNKMNNYKSIKKH
jgi:hypothetical protein